MNHQRVKRLMFFIIRILLTMVALLTVSMSLPVFAEDWWVGKVIGLCRGTQIRTGPGYGYNAHTTVPENDWAVKIIDGPRNGDWWDTSRKAAGDPSGGTGWVKKSEAESCKQSSEPPQPPPPPQQIPPPPPPPPSQSCSVQSGSPSVGKIIGLPRGMRIYYGPVADQNSNYHTIVPQDNWAVKIIDGPRYINDTAGNEWEWWDTSRHDACDPSGGTGWVPWRISTPAPPPPPPPQSYQPPAPSYQPPQQQPASQPAQQQPAQHQPASQPAQQQPAPQPAQQQYQPPEAQISFWVDNSTISAGQCTTLRWDIENVKAVYLNGQGAEGHEARQVCPSSTTAYNLRVVTYQGEVNRSIEISVTQPQSVPQPPAPPPSSSSSSSSGSVPQSPTLSVGGCAQVFNLGDMPLRIRSGPGVGYSQVGKLYDGTVVRIIGGPSSGDGYTWWQHDHGGWSASDWLKEASCENHSSSIPNNQPTTSPNTRFTSALWVRTQMPTLEHERNYGVFKVPAGHTNPQLYFKIDDDHWVYLGKDQCRIDPVTRPGYISDPDGINSAYIPNGYIGMAICGSTSTIMTQLWLKYDINDPARWILFYE